MKANTNYNNLQDSYLFSTIAKKVAAYSSEHPDKKIIRLGIGDVTKPLCPAVIKALHSAVDDMAAAETFHGYGPEQGYGFLKEAVHEYYKKNGVSLDIDEIFIGDGAKDDLSELLDIFGKDNKVLVPDPVYPVYVDTNIMDGREISYVSATEENGFLPVPPSDIHADIIYLCSPNNPTGAVFDKAQLKEWVDYATANRAVILFDSAYEAFISDKSLPHSIYEIEGAKSCAIELCSLSKTAGFTGTRCGYTIIPKALLSDEGMSFNSMWLRRRSTKTNGTAYIIQKAAEAVFTDEGYKETRADIAYYMENAKIIAEAMDELGIWYVGGKNSPYIWLKCPNGMKSWDFFDYLLENANVVGTPGQGFGENGEGYFRLTAFGNRENTIEAVRRIKELLGK